MVKAYEYCRLPDGRPVTAYEITNSFGESAVILNYGASIGALKVLDRSGNISDVVLGADPGQDVSTAGYVGSLMGRCGNRIANAAFEIDGKQFHLAPMEGPHHLHGAEGNWARQLFEGEIGQQSVILRHRDDGRDGWGCPVEAEITYQFDDSHALTLTYQVKALGDTVISPTNHAYFNLNAPQDVLDTVLEICTDSYAPKSDYHMPDGRIDPVAGTPLDFHRPRSFRQALEEGPKDFFPPYQDSFDDFYIVPGSGFRKMASAYCPQNGRQLSIYSDAQCVILYTPVVEKPVENKGGSSYQGHIAFCLETQYVPNAVNCPQYRSPVFKEGQVMHSKTVYAFDVR